MKTKQKTFTDVICGVRSRAGVFPAAFCTCFFKPMIFIHGVCEIWWERVVFFFSVVFIFCEETNLECCRDSCFTKLMHALLIYGVERLGCLLPAVSKKNSNRQFWSLEIMGCVYCGIDTPACTTHTPAHIHTHIHTHTHTHV